MHCQCYPRGGCRHRSPVVKRLTGSTSNHPMIIDNGPDSWHFPAGVLKRNWPGLHQVMRNSGNRRLNPHVQINQGYESLIQHQRSWTTWDTLLHMSSKRGPLFDRYPGMDWQDYNNSLYRLYEAADKAIMVRDFYLLEEILIEVLNVFSVMEKVLGRNSGYGFGSRLDANIIDATMHFTPMVSDITPEYTFMLLQLTCQLTGYDSTVLRRLLNALSPTGKIQLFDYVEDFIAMGHNSYLAHQILQMLGGSTGVNTGYPPHGGLATCMACPSAVPTLPFIGHAIYNAVNVPPLGVTGSGPGVSTY